MQDCLGCTNVQQEQSLIGPSLITINNIKIMPSMVQIIESSQFHGLPTKDSMAHMTRFIDYYATLRMDGVSIGTIRFMLFLFLLMNRVEKWFASLAPKSIHTWDEMYTIFFDKYFPLTKALQLKD